jgi:CheY-like chemotaxis protein
MGRARILVIDDDSEVRAAIAEALTLDGYEVETALDGSEGTVLVGQKPYDLIFCDLRMPELDGRALYQEFRGRCPGVLKRLVFVTGMARTAEYESFLRKTGMQVLPKPFTIHQLKGVVARMIGPQVGAR